MATALKKTSKTKKTTQAPAKTASKTPAKAAGKAPVKAKAAPKAASRVGGRYGCTECGLLVTIDRDCNCGTIDLVCCGEPMKKKRAACK